MNADDDGVNYEVDDEDEDAYDHDFVPQCSDCGEPHEDCECEGEFEQDDWCAECGEVASHANHGG